MGGRLSALERIALSARVVIEKFNGVLDPAKEDDKSGQEEATNINSTNRLNTVSSSINTVSSSFTTMDLGREKAQRNEFESVFGQDKDANGNSIYRMFTHVNVVGSSCDNLGGSVPVNAATLPNVDFPTDPLMPDLEDTANLLNTGIFSGAYNDEDVGVEADFNNLETTMNVSLIPITRIHKDHLKNQIIGDINSATQTRRTTKISKEHAMVEKALYGLHQAPKAWYETLSTYLLENGFRRGTIDKTLFIKKEKGDILLVQGCKSCKEIMESSSAHTLTLPPPQYLGDILKKFDFVIVKTASTPIETNKALLKDEEAEDVDVHLYRSMIGSLMYLTAFRPDIMFVVCACARDSPFNLEAFSYSDYAGASLDKKSTTGGYQFLGKRLISWQCKKQTVVANSTTEAEYVVAANCCGQNTTGRTVDNGEQEITATVDGKEFTYLLNHPLVNELPQTSKPIPNVVDEAVYEEWDDRVERATTTVASLDAAQASEAIGGSIAQTRSERVPTQPYDSLLLRVNTLGNDEDSMQLQELMALCTKLSDRVLALETYLRQTKKVYGAAYTKLIMKVKKLEKTVESNQARRRAKIVVSDDEKDLEDSSKQGRMTEEIDQDAGVTLVTPTHSQEDQPEDQLGVFSEATNVHTYTRRRRAVSTGSGGVSTASRLF
ncbi:putative ribonuclease H-like domain-containing protein, partial [Tanacetum coccineum]